MTKKYYFPPIGFGLWYQFGVLHAIPEEEDSELYGSSGGSVVCFVSLLKKEDCDLDTILKLYQKIYRSHWWDFSQCLHQFLKQIGIILQSYEDSYLRKKLSRIYIEVSEWKWGYVRGKFIQPTSIQDLQHLVQASCYVPILFWQKNPFFYSWKDEWYFDGFFANFSQIDDSFIKINSYQYGTMIPKGEDYFRLLYEKGRQYNFTQRNEPFTFFMFMQMTWNIVRDFFQVTLSYMPHWNRMIQR